MRPIGLLAVLAIPGTAGADPFVEAVGGLSIPAGDDAWTNYAETSPKLGVRAGALEGDLGGMIQADWTPVQLHTAGGSIPVGSIDLAGHVFRFLADAVIQHHVAPKLSLSARVGAGVDLAYGSYGGTLLGVTTSHSNTDLGFAFELGGGAWFDVSPTIQLGGELALPISHHSSSGQVGDIAFDYTSYSVDLLLGVRLTSR